MPSPVGHALAGVAAGYLAGGGHLGRVSTASIGGQVVPKIPSIRRVTTFGVLGVLADIDFLFGSHSTYTHSVGAILVVGALFGLAGPMRGLRIGVAAASAYGSHVLLDWLGSDAVAPVGIMALWPLSSEFFLSDRQWFMSVCREYWRAGCWWHNARGLVHELVVLGPIAAAAIYVATRVSKRSGVPITRT